MCYLALTMIQTKYITYSYILNSINNIIMHLYGV